MRSRLSSSMFTVAVLAQLGMGGARGQEIVVFSEVDVPVPRPKVAVVGGGFVVTWNDGAGRRYDLDGNLLGSFPAGVGYYNDVAGNEAAGFVVAWWGWDDGIAYARRFDAEANAVGEIFALSPPPDEGCRNINPVVALNREGKLAVCWKRWVFDDDPRNAFFARVFDPEGVEAVATFKVADFIGIHENPAAIAMNDAGQFVVAWHSAPEPSTYYHTYVQLFAADGTRSGDLIHLGQGQYPGVAMNLEGFAVTMSGVLRAYDLQGTMRYESPLQGSSSFTGVAMNSSGSMAAVWDDWTDGKSQGIFARRFDGDGPAGDPFQVNIQTGGMLFEPRVAMSDAGDVVLAWPRESIIDHHFYMDVFARVVRPDIVFVRGDANVDGGLDISDPIITILYMFDFVELSCLDAADIDDNGKLNILDPLYSLLLLFAEDSVAPPPPPFPEPGADPTADDLGCAHGL